MSESKTDDGYRRSVVDPQPLEIEIHRLREELRNAAEALTQAKSEAALAGEAKNRLVFEISHELRTPLSAIALWTSLLCDKTDQLPEATREGLDAIQRAARNLTLLLDDLLDMSRLTAGKLAIELREMKFDPILKSVVESLQPDAHENGVALSLHLDPNPGSVRIDPHRMEQVLRHVLSNALKFTPTGGQIDVSTRSCDEHIEMQVVDTGRGISPELLPRIFDRFGRIDQGSPNKQSGLGLGLSLSKRLVELQGGMISAQSPGPERGSTLTIRLPLVRRI